MIDQFVGVDLGGTKLLMVCGAETYRVGTGADFSPEDLEKNIRQFVGRLPQRPTSVGIAVPALVQDAERIVTCDVLPKMAGWSATAHLSDMGCRIIVVNDVKAALAEEMHDAAAGITAGIIMVGTAVGAAFITEGRVLSGASGWAGELGYMPIRSGSDVRRLDEFAGGSFMAASRNVSTEEFVRLAIAQDLETLNILREGGEALGLAVATVINLLNPSRLAVGGGTMTLPRLWEAAQEAAARYSIPELWKACRLYRIPDDPSLTARGAARCLTKL